MADATKFLDYAGLEYILGKLKERKVFGNMGLSAENFTAELKTKYDALVAASSVEDLTELFTRVTALEALVETDSDGVINKLNEIITFLAGIEDTKTLEGIMAGKADKNVVDTLSTKMVAAESNISALQTSTANKADKSVVDALSTTVNGKQDAMTAITTAEIDLLISAGA